MPPWDEFGADENRRSGDAVLRACAVRKLQCYNVKVGYRNAFLLVVCCCKLGRGWEGDRRNRKG